MRGKPVSYFKKKGGTAVKDDVVHEHARLVLMELDGVDSSFIEFSSEMWEEFPGLDLVVLQEVYAAYCGWDGYALPSRSIETGARL